MHTQSTFTAKAITVPHSFTANESAIENIHTVIFTEMFTAHR